MPRAQDQLPSRFRRAVLYVVEQLGEVSVTKLQKILYLSDLEHYYATGTTLTGARWVRYTYGPMAKALLPSRGLMEGHELTVTAEEWGDREAHVYRPGPSPRFRPGLSAEEKDTIDRILDITRELAVDDVVTLAYSTAPMRFIQTIERAQGAVLIGVDVPFDLEPAALVAATTDEAATTPEERAAFKRGELQRVRDLQEGALTAALS